MAHYWTAVEWGAYERKTAHLSLVQHGAYWLLLKHYYQTQKPLPANAELLLRVCRAFADDEKAAVLSVLNEFFVLEDDGYHNERADEELAKASQISEKRRVAGKKGAEKTNGKCPANDAANAEQMPTQLQSQSFCSSSKFELPVWVPESDWKDYEEMRRRIKKPMTRRARELAVSDLEKLMESGQDPSEVLKQSIKNSWQGLFELRKNGGTNGKTAQQLRGERIERLAGERSEIFD